MTAGHVCSRRNDARVGRGVLRLLSRASGRQPSPIRDGDRRLRPMQPPTPQEDHTEDGRSDADSQRTRPNRQVSLAGFGIPVADQPETSTPHHPASCSSAAHANQSAERSKRCLLLAAAGDEISDRAALAVAPQSRLPRRVWRMSGHLLLSLQVAPHRRITTMRDSRRARLRAVLVGSGRCW